MRTEMSCSEASRASGTTGTTSPPGTSTATPMRSASSACANAFTKYAVHDAPRRSIPLTSTRRAHEPCAIVARASVIRSAMRRRIAVRPLFEAGAGAWTGRETAVWTPASETMSPSPSPAKRAST